MGMVKFATTCDRCGDRSAEYTAWPTCRECGDYICPKHQRTGSFRDADVDTPESCVCGSCENEDDIRHVKHVQAAIPGVRKDIETFLALTYYSFDGFCERQEERLRRSMEPQTDYAREQVRGVRAMSKEMLIQEGNVEHRGNTRHYQGEKRHAQS